MKKNGIFPLLLIFLSCSLVADNATPTPAVEKLNPGNPNGGGPYDAKALWGQPVFKADKTLDYVEENPLLTHERKNCVFVVVSGYGAEAKKNNFSGRVRLAVWNSEEIFSKEGIRPFRAASHWVKDGPEKLRFKICGLRPGSKYSFFTHYDIENTGKVKRGFLGLLPVEPYGFTDAQNPGQLVKRVGLGAPSFERTAIVVKAALEEIPMVMQ